MKYQEMVEDTIGKKYIDLGEVGGGLSNTYKRKIHFNNAEWMVKILPGDSLRFMWYCELIKISGVHLAVPQKVKLFNNNTLCLISPWIEGSSLEDVLITADETDVQKYAEQAADILARLHSLTINYPEISERIKKQFLDVCAKVEEMQLTFPHREECCQYVRNRVNSYSPSVICAIHKDIRPENFLIGKNGLCLIDFDNGSLGEPASDFAYLTTMGADIHRKLSKKLILSYLKKCVVKDFWEKNMLYSIKQVMEYAIGKFEVTGKQVEFQAKNLWEQYDGFNRVVPKWFDKGE